MPQFSAALVAAVWRGAAQRHEACAFYFSSLTPEGLDTDISSKTAPYLGFGYCGVRESLIGGGEA
jgi:hypothetical protein